MEFLKGYKLVPVEPTEHQMKIARSMTMQQEQTVGAEYRAMVKAAPALPSTSPVSWQYRHKFEEDGEIEIGLWQHCEEKIYDLLQGRKNTETRQLYTASTVCTPTPPKPICSALNFVCTALPGPGNECAFVELENDAGESLGYGEWRNRDDGLVELHIAAPQPIYDEAKALSDFAEWWHSTPVLKENIYTISRAAWLACAQSRAKAGEETP